MRIGLISPKGVSFGNTQKFQDFLKNEKYMKTYLQSLTGLSTGLLIIAALTPSEHEIELIDENFDEIDFSKNYDLVGITAMTQQATRAYQIADEFWKRNTKVIIGGIHATLLPEEARQHADSVVIGEAEYLWPMVLADLAFDRLKTVYRTDKVVDLKDSPVPRYDLMKEKNYKVAWIQTTRGCPHDCEFCAASKIYGSRYRNKTIEQVINEIQVIKKKFGNILISFADDNLFVKRKYSEVFLEEIKGLNIRWNAQTDISIAEHDELLRAMKESGCFCLFIGFESLSEANMQTIDRYGWKFRNLSMYPEYIKKIQSYGIGVHGAFIIGLPHDDKSIFKGISDFIIENHLYDAQITISTPLPGTRLREQLVKEGRVLPTKWEDYTFIDVNYVHNKLTKDELENGLIEIYRRINCKDAYYNKMNHFKLIKKELFKEN